MEQAVSVGKLFAAVACSVSQWCRNAYATTVLVLKKHKQRILDEQLLTPEPRRFFAQDGSGSSSPQTTLRCSRSCSAQVSLRRTTEPNERFSRVP